MAKRTQRWETMDKNHIPLRQIAETYYTTCQIEGKTLKTLRGYREKLGRFIRWLDGALSDFTLTNVREYLQELKQTNRFEGHPFTPKQSNLLSDQTIINYVRVLKGFATWLMEEEYTENNILARLAVPRGTKKLLPTLSPLEITAIVKSLNPRTHSGSRDLAIALLFLDTGLRCAELLTLTMDDLHLDSQWLRVMGKGRKERVTPFGSRVTKVLQRYIGYFRPQPQGPDNVFLTMDGRPLTENSIELILSRLGQRSGVAHLHIHLLRHTFATNYLISGGDPFSLQQILGHSTLETTRRYVNQAAVQTMVKERKLSPADIILAASEVVNF